MTRKSRRKSNNLLSIVIPFYKGYNYIYECIEKIPDAVGDISYDVVVVDDGNEKDHDYDALSQHLRDLGIKLVRLSKNSGYPAAVNAGVKRSFSPLIMCLTIDVMCEPKSINSLVMRMDDPKVGLAGMKLIFPLDSTDPNRPPGKVQHVGIHTDIMGRLLHTFVGWSEDNPKIDDVDEVMAVTGAAFITRRRLWNEIEGFWEGYGRGTMEDVEYALRVRELGYNVVVDSSAKAFHHVGITPREFGEPFPINNNYMLFRQRNQSRIRYWEYKVV